jgi:hypothetical protein
VSLFLSIRYNRTIAQLIIIKQEKEKESVTLCRFEQALRAPRISRQTACEGGQVVSL